MALFKREVIATVGNQGETGLRVKDLDVFFAIESDITPEPDRAEVTIYNLSAESRNIIANLNSTGRVIVEAGYTQNQDSPGTSIIFEGDVTRTTSALQDGDIVTTIEASSGLLSRSLTKRLDKSYPKLTTLRKVIEDLAAVANVAVPRSTLNQLSLGNTALQFPKGKNVSGPAWETLVHLLEDSGFKPTVQAGALFVTPVDASAVVVGVKLTPQTGLLGTPYIDDNGLLTGRSLMIPDMLPGRFVQVTSEFISGTFQLESCTYSGSLFENDFGIEFTGRSA